MAALDLTKRLAIRWTQPDPQHLPLLKQIGIEAAILSEPNPDFSKAASAAGIITALESEVQTVERGHWPGIRREPSRRYDPDADTASASREPWIDANGYLVAVERALNPGVVHPVLGYKPDEKAGLTNGRIAPFETLELALAEARVIGGNYLLAMDPAYRKALLASDPKAVKAWKSLGQTAAWLKANDSLFGRPMLPVITALVEPGFPTAEIANMLCRRNASPSIVAATAVPRPDASRIAVLVAAGLKTVPDAIWGHAQAGSTVVIDLPPRDGWKLVKEEPDRRFFQLGSGQVVAYKKKAVMEPSEFALDVIDLANYKRRTVRTWNVLSAMSFASTSAVSGEALLHVVNYGSPAAREWTARILGRFSKATLLRPEVPPIDLKVYPRGTQTEINLPNLGRVAVVRFR